MSAIITPFPVAARLPRQIGFERDELTRILDLYGRMVAAGNWRDYAIDLGRDVAVFSAFRRRRRRFDGCRSIGFFRCLILSGFFFSHVNSRSGVMDPKRNAVHIILTQTSH